MAKKWMLRAIWALLIIFSNLTSAMALNVIEKENFYIYYPDGATSLAVKLSRQAPEMAAFMSNHALPLSLPIHIILDDELDHPEVQTNLFPHRAIRIPIRAPGVLEDGYTEADPWRYFLFKGLSILAISSERSGLPGSLYWIFGEIISPNLILPDWIFDGISHLLYEQWVQRRVKEPLSAAIFKATPVPDLDRVSNHPEIWPGRFSYRIYGRPFVRWLHQRYGWKKLLTFIQRHGRGILPLEIDIKAKLTFGLSWNQIWRYFQAEHIPLAYDDQGFSISGYWDNPFVYWNAMGIYPGSSARAQRSRYGFVDPLGWLWHSQYTNGVAELKLQNGDTIRTLNIEHVWDPGPGAVAVSREGARPHLVLFDARTQASSFGDHYETIPIKNKISVPPHIIQLSGPVMDSDGRIAVAANSGGNWDIWLYDGVWHQVTDAPSIEMDPWLANNRLIFSSNSSGTFQLQGADMRALTTAPVAATLPRGQSYLNMGATGWQLKTIDGGKIPALPTLLPVAEPDTPKPDQSDPAGTPYSAFKSIWPNQLRPDINFNSDDFQIGLSTEAFDVSKAYAWDAGIRYDTDRSRFTWRLGWQANQFSARATHYPFGYQTQRQLQNMTLEPIEVSENRTEIRVAYAPLQLKGLSLAANWRHYRSVLDDRLSDSEGWASLGFEDPLGRLHLSTHLDLFDDGSQSLYGSMYYWFGQRINTLIKLEAGKTWGDLKPGHNTFRIGGYSTEGDFTRRTTRLFPLRGFEANTLDAGQAAVLGVEMVLPLARLQTGYKTLPLFLHNISVGTFVDAGFASDRFRSEDFLIGAGFELITGMQLAWGSRSDFRIGVAWPIQQPDAFEDKGAIILIQIGSPL